MAQDIRQIAVTDIMTIRIELVAETTPIGYVATIMRQKQISGLPVTDDEGAVSGVITAADLLRVVRGKGDDHAAAIAERAFYADVLPSVLLSPELLGSALEGTARDYMSNLVVSVSTSATVQQASQIMTDAGVHRVLVLDRNGNLAGLVTSSDIVRLVAG